MTTSKLIGTLASLCYELNAPDYHVFFDYSGHVDMLSVSVSAGGWNRHEVPLRIGAVYVDGVPDPENHVQDVIATLREHHDNYRKDQQQ